MDIMRVILAFALAFLFSLAGYAQQPQLKEFDYVGHSKEAVFLVRKADKVGSYEKLNFTALIGKASVEGPNLYLDPDNFVILRIQANCTTRDYGVLIHAGILSGKVGYKETAKPVFERAPEGTAVESIIKFACTSHFGPMV